MRRSAHLRTEKSLVEKARTAAMERMASLSSDSCFSALNRPNKGELGSAPFAVAILTGERCSV